MCEYCNSNNDKGNAVINFQEYTGMWYIDDEKYLIFENVDGESEHCKINYCPMCGEKLNADNN